MKLLKCGVAIDFLENCVKCYINGPQKNYHYIHVSHEGLFHELVTVVFLDLQKKLTRLAELLLSSRSLGVFMNK